MCPYALLCSQAPLVLGLGAWSSHDLRPVSGMLALDFGASVLGFCVAGGAVLGGGLPQGLGCARVGGP